MLFLVLILGLCQTLRGFLMQGLHTYQLLFCCGALLVRDCQSLGDLSLPSLPLCFFLLLGDLPYLELLYCLVIEGLRTVSLFTECYQPLLPK